MIAMRYTVSRCVKRRDIARTMTSPFFVQVDPSKTCNTGTARAVVECSRRYLDLCIDAVEVGGTVQICC